MTETLEWLNGSDAANFEKEDYDKRAQRLDEMFHPISTELYKGGEGGAEGDEPGEGAEGGMPNLSPDQMAQFDAMMKDPAKRAQMEQMAKQMGMGSMGSMGSMDKTGSSKGSDGPKVEEID